MSKSPKVKTSGLCAALAPCRKEEEVKAEFCRFFGMKINALRTIDHYTESILFEFKYDRNFKAAGTVAAVVAQTMYYARLLKFDLAQYPLPPFICVVDKNEAFFLETKAFARFYATTSAKYDWDRAASTPCPVLVADVAAHPATKAVYVYDLTNPEEETQFIEAVQQRRLFQPSLFPELDRKAITEDNFLDVFSYWDGLFGKYVKNGRKPSEYFLADIETGKAVGTTAGDVLFDVAGDGVFVRKTLPPKPYEHFWERWERVAPDRMPLLRQKADRLTEDFRRRFTGEFYTPVPFATKGLEYLERELGREWWKSGEWRFWDMAGGTGNLEFNLPSSALPYCYISTLEADDAKYCAKIFPAATCFQYDYLADDVPILAGQMTYGAVRKMPANLAADLANPKIKWIVFINPPFATANTTGGETGKTSKNSVSKTTIREWMNTENYGEASRELFTQFLFRISKEFASREARLCLFSKLKYLNSNNDQMIRDGFFQYVFCRGFCFPSKAFHGAKGSFPVGFLIWNLAKRKHLSEQEIVLDVFNVDVEKVGTKRIPSVERTAMLNKWCPRPKWDGQSVMPTFSSGLKVMDENKDKRNHIAPGFLCSLSSNGDDFQHQNSVFLLSAPYANAGAFSVTPDNFEKAMVLHAVKKVPKATWTNDRDSFYSPTAELTDEFISDCVVWTSFADSNYTVSLKDVSYQGKLWQIPNNLYPFSVEIVRTWPCALPTLATQLAAANEDRFLAKWLKGRALSPEARAVTLAASNVYRAFYAKLRETPWMDWKIETWDAGFYQIRGALKAAGLAETELAALKTAHDKLGEKLLPRVYDYGFLNPDVSYFS